MAYGKEFLDKIKDNKSKDSNNVILDATRGSYIGAGIGLSLGLLIGYNRKYNLLVSAFIGATIGGLLTKKLINK